MGSAGTNLPFAIFDRKDALQETPHMIRITTLTLLAVLGSPFAVSCASAPPPFRTPHQAYRGFKARTFVGTPKEIRPAIVATLRDMGFEVHPDSEIRNYITGNRGMAAQPVSLSEGQRKWMRVGVQVRFIDQHRRAPRTLVEIDAENIQGTSELIEASFGSVPSDFYAEFFDRIETTVKPESVPRGLLPPA